MAFSTYSYQTTIVGSIIRLASGNRFLKYPDEVQFPAKYTSAHISRMETHMSQMQSRGGRPPMRHAQSRPHPELDGPAAGEGQREMNEKGAKRQGAMAPGTDGVTSNAQTAARTTPPGTPMDDVPTRSDSEHTVTDPATHGPAGSGPIAAKKQGQGQGGGQVQAQGEQPTGYQPAEGETYEDPNLVTWYGPDDPENP